MISIGFAKSTKGIFFLQTDRKRCTDSGDQERYDNSPVRTQAKSVLYGMGAVWLRFLNLSGDVLLPLTAVRAPQ